MSHTTAMITVSAEMRGSVFVAGIPPRRYTYGPTQADFTCGATNIIACSIGALSATNPSHKTLRATVETRLAAFGGSRNSGGSASGGYLALVVHADVPEPEFELLSYVSEVGIAKGAQLFVVWTAAEACATVVSLCESASSAANTAMRPKAREGGTEAVVDFLTTSKQMNRLDATRFADRFTTPAEMLAAAQQDLESLPGFGVGRAKKMHSVLLAEFPTTRRRLHEVDVGATQQHHTQQQAASAAATSQRRPVKSTPAATSVAPLQPIEVDAGDDDGGDDDGRTGKPPVEVAAVAPRPSVARPSGPRRSANQPPASVAAALARRQEAEALLEDSQPALPTPADGRQASQDVTLEHVLRQLAAPQPDESDDG